MKKIIFIACLVGAGLVAPAQITYWTENFDPSGNGPDSVSSVFNGTHGFDLTTSIWSSAPNCDTAFIDVGDTIDLRTDPINFGSNTFITLSFDHICKTDFFDIATLELSFDGGASWFQLTNEYITDDLFGPAPNSSSYELQGYTFNESSWGNAWQPGNPGAIPANSWWRTDYFDLSGWATIGLPVIIRWVLYDGPSPPGGNGKWGWAIDNIKIEMAPCELTAPTVNQLGIVWQNTVYNLGPYNVQLNATDASGIDSVYMYYTVNGGPLNTVQMTWAGGSLYNGQIPMVNDSDTVCYYFYVTDSSACANATYLPATGCIQFVASSGITYPYCDDFDAQNLWTDSLSTGSAWQLGMPAFGLTTGTHSGPNAWDITLASPYLGSSEAYLTSPILSPIAANTKVSFWLNHNTENNFDGVRLETSTNGTTWTVLGNLGNTCGCQTNWYNTNLISSNTPGWAGNSSISLGGWYKAEYEYPAASVGSQIQFRFVFTSDAIVQLDGFSIDDFCIEEPQPWDAGVTVINQPNASAPAGNCDTVIVTYKNFGLNTITDLNLWYSVDSIGGTGPVPYGPFPWSGNLAAGGSIQVGLPCYLVPTGSFTICAWTDLANDGNHFNDTVCTTLTGVPVLSLTNCDDLEQGNLGYQLSSSGPGTVWAIGMPGYGLTSSAYSGALVWDVNLNTPYTTNSTCTLTTPIYDVAGAINPSFSFWQNRHLNLNDGMYVQYSFNGTAWNTLWDNNVPSLPGTAQNWYTTNNFIANLPGWNGSSGGWVKSTYYMHNILIANPAQQYIQFRFIFRSGTSAPLSGISIDDICFTQPGPQDAGVILFNTPTPGSYGPVGTTSPVSVVIQNFGSQAITSTNIVWAVNGVPVDTTLWNGGLSPGTVSTAFTLGGQLSYPTGLFELCAYTQLIMDNDTTNDTTCIFLTGIPVLPLTYSQSYCDDFESGNVGWTVIVNGVPTTTWQLGTPAYGATTGAHSGTNAWDINLTGPYTQVADVVLVSPYFDLSNAVDTKLSFWRNHNTQANSDGVHLEYSVNGLPWTNMGGIGLPAPYQNWYSGTLPCNPSNMGWSGSSGSWVETRMDNLGVLGFNGQSSVQFRFRFCTNTFTVLDGFSIDDFCLEVPVPLTAAPVTIGDNAPIPLIFAGQQLTFEAHVKNRGTTDLTEVDAELWIDGNQVGTDNITFNPPLQTNDSVLHTFVLYPWTAIAGNTDVCVVTSNPNALNDQNPTDDTICYVVQVIDTINVTGGTVYCNDFDGAQPQWATLSAYNYGPTSSWEMGVPASPSISTANSPPNVWATNLTGNYPSLDESALFTPAFTIDGNNLYKFEFSHIFVTELWADGGAVDYSTDYGTTWQQLGLFTLGSFWYNAPYVIAFDLPPAPGFSGSTAVYLNSSQDLCFSQGTSAVIFRFRFESDFSQELDGWAVDDVCFRDLGPCPVGISENDNDQAFELEQNVPNPANEITTIGYTLPSMGDVVFEVTDLLGNSVAVAEASKQMAGRHTVTFNTATVRPGIYLYSITYKGTKQVRKMVITN